MPFLSLLTKGKPGGFAFQALVTGSKGEDLAIPLTFSFDEDLDINFIKKADLDLMFEVPEEQFDGKDRFIQTEGVHPGYFRYSGRETDFALGIAHAVCDFPQLMGQMHGPSVMANTPLKAVDHVIAFKFFGWPEVAQEFCSRDRPSGWPSNQLVTEIVQGGCHMVLKPHNFTDKDVHNEWRLSFSIAEKKLATSLTKTQKMAYVLFKILQREYFQFQNEITSYHLKTALFWQCEKSTEEECSNHNLAKLLLSMIEWLHRCLTDHNLPNYFIPANNLIDHIPGERIRQIEITVGHIKENILKYLLEYFKKNRIIGSAFSVGSEDYQSIIEQMLDPDQTKSRVQKQELRTDAAIKCASWQVADFYISEKVIHDTAQFSFIPDEGTLAAYLIKYYLQNQMVPLRAASFILQEVLPEESSQKKHLDLKSGTSARIFHCLANIDDKMNAQLEGMADDSEADRVIQLFLEHDLPSVQLTVQELQRILDEEGQFEILEPDSDSRSRLKATWDVLSHLVAYCFIILNDKDRKNKQRYLEKLQQLKSSLTKLPGFQDVLNCCQHLEAFSLLVMDNYIQVEAILESPVLKPRAAIFLRKMMSLRKGKLLVGQADSQWCWGRVPLRKFPTGQKEMVSAKLKEWYLSESKCDRNPRQMNILSRIIHDTKGDDLVGLLFESHDRTLQDSCLMRWEEDVAHNMLVPAGNLLKPGLQSMMEKLLAPPETNEALSIHPVCKLAMAKNLLMLKSSDKAIGLLKEIVDAKCSNEFYRVFPLECRLMLDDRALSGKTLRIQDHFDFSITVYALFLLVKCYTQTGEIQIAKEKTEEMVKLCKELLNDNHSDSYPWQVLSNNLVLLGTAQNICGNRSSSLAAFAHVALLIETKGPLLKKVEIQDLQMDGRTTLDAMQDSLVMLTTLLNPTDSCNALGCFLDVLYPEANLETALTRLMHYCMEDGHCGKGTSDFFKAISSTST